MVLITYVLQLENLPQQNRTKNDGAYETGLTTMVMVWYMYIYG